MPQHRDPFDPKSEGETFKAVRQTINDLGDLVKFIVNSLNGNFIVVRHYDKYTTAYGHLSAFAKGLHKGDRVKQGDTIGYVGSTGWATGPHLHYEFRINDVHQDPLTVSLPNATPLSHQNLSSFRQETAALAAQLGLAQRTTTARLD